MQHIDYTISSGKCIQLFRGIPAEIQIGGIEDTSGTWVCLIENDWRDGTILSGTVTASGGDLLVTLAEMNTVELAAAIADRETLSCRATLTDKSSKIYYIPIVVQNAAVEGPMPHVADYYTKAEIDEIIAGIHAGGGVASVNGDPGPDVVLDAKDVHALSAFGVDMQDIEIGEMEGTVIHLSPDKIFVHTLTAGEVFSFDESNLTANLQVNCEVHLIQPATPVSFTLPAGILWSNDGEREFSASNDPPDFSTGNTLYALVFRWNGSKILCNLAYCHGV